jgi:hypothetical protein
MNYGQPCAARALSSSATIQITIPIALFALLAVCGPLQRAALGAVQISTTKLPGRESQSEVRKPPAGEDQARMAEPRRRLSDEPADYVESIRFRGVMQPPSAAVAGNRDTRRGSIPPNPRLGLLFEPATRDALHADSIAFAVFWPSACSSPGSLPIRQNLYRSFRRCGIVRHSSG